MKLLVADTVRHERESLTSFLDLLPDLTVVGTASDGAEALRVAKAQQPDVVVMSANVASDDGGVAARQLARLPAPPRVILLALRVDASTQCLATRVGAHACVETSAGVDQLVETIRSVPGMIPPGQSTAEDE